MTTLAEDEVREHMVRAFDLFNQKSVDEFRACFAPEFTNFYIDQGSLMGLIEADALQELYDAGLSPNFSTRDMRIAITGDAAYVVSYVDGSITRTSGETISGPWRFSAFLIRSAPGWKIAHNHWSTLE